MNVISKLGFGMMRLPMTGDKIDRDAVCEMADRFLDAGGVWFDTAWPYHNGESEPLVRQSVVERHPRTAFRLATKLPVWLIQSPEDAQRCFTSQLARTGAGSLDRYLLHALGKERVKTLDEHRVWDFMKSLKAKGLVKSIGFSFHDDPEVLEQILNDHPEMEFVQLQINYLDWEDESVQSRRIYEIARAHDKPIIVMEPIKGGILAALPEKAALPLRRARPDWSDARWALSYCLSLPGVDLILSGMSDGRQMAENLDTFSHFEPLTEADYAALKETVKILRSLPAIPCTACGYCVEGCPAQIKIPEVFKTATKVMQFGPQPSLTRGYAMLVGGGSGRASDCLNCGACEEICPQHLKIPRLMGECAALLDR